MNTHVCTWNYRWTEVTDFCESENQCLGRTRWRCACNTSGVKPTVLFFFIFLLKQKHWTISVFHNSLIFHTLIWIIHWPVLSNNEMSKINNFLMMAVNKQKEVTGPTFVFCNAVSWCNVCTKHSHLEIACKWLLREILQLGWNRALGPHGIADCRNNIKQGNQL